MVKPHFSFTNSRSTLSFWIHQSDASIAEFHQSDASIAKFNQSDAAVSEIVEEPVHLGFPTPAVSLAEDVLKV